MGLTIFLRRLYERLFIILFLIPVFVYFFLLVSYAQNIPATDDFHATLSFINNFVYAKLDTAQRIDLLFSQHNEHRIVVSRLLALLLYAVTGEINFVYFLLLDTLFLVGLTVLLFFIYNKVHSTARWYNYLFPTLLLFNPKTYETFLFVSGGSQAYTVLFFTVLSIWLLSLSCLAKNDKRIVLFSLSILSALLATFSFGSGFLVWVGGSVFLLYSYSWKYLILWSLTGILAIGYYFYDFHQFVTTAEPVQFGFNQVLHAAKGFILFPGASFLVYWPTISLTKMQVGICYGIGFFSFVYFIRLFIKGYGKQCPLLFSLLTVAVGVGTILTVSRSGSGSSILFTSRYMVFTNFIAIIMYGILIQQRVRFFNNKGWVVIPLSIIFINSLIISLPEMNTIYKKQQGGFESWYVNKTPTLYIEAKFQADANQIIRQSIQTGVFVPRLKKRKPVSNQTVQSY